MFTKWKELVNYMHKLHLLHFELHDSLRSQNWLCYMPYKPHIWNESSQSTTLPYQIYNYVCLAENKMGKKKIYPEGHTEPP